MPSPKTSPPFGSLPVIPSVFYFAMVYLGKCVLCCVVVCCVMLCCGVVWCGVVCVCIWWCDVCVWWWCGVVWCDVCMVWCVYGVCVWCGVCMVCVCVHVLLYWYMQFIGTVKCLSSYMYVLCVVSTPLLLAILFDMGNPLFAFIYLFLVSHLLT